MHTVGIVWHLHDLRLPWNEALSQAIAENTKIIPLYIYVKEMEKLGGASRFWLFHSLESLAKEYKERGAKLILRKGDPFTQLSQILSQTGAKTVYFNQEYEPTLFQMQERVRARLEGMGITVKIFNSNHLIDPLTLFAKSGKPYIGFAPFYKAALKLLTIRPTRLPKKISSLAIKSNTLESLKITFHEKWMKKLQHYWHPSRQEGLAHLKNFIKKKSETSQLSPYIHFGQISPQEAWKAAKGHHSFLRQLIWREFSTYFLVHFPDAETKNWNPKYNRFKWNSSFAPYQRWVQGMTGYPIIDASMRQLWEMGWIHNRLRMVVASFLIKDLLIDWKKGEAWFWDTLVDADKGNNVFGWQWCFGSGPDACPYFRIFNPVLQGEKFDPHGTYIRKYIPELKNLPTQWIHHPWDAPKEVLEKAKIELGRTYPHPIVDHKNARAVALKKFHSL